MQQTIQVSCANSAKYSGTVYVDKAMYKCYGPVCWEGLQQAQQTWLISCMAAELEEGRRFVSFYLVIGLLPRCEFVSKFVSGAWIIKAA